MRRPNGTGSIIKMPGARRKPYAVRICSRDKRGRVQQHYLSYHATAADAQAALDAYNASKATGAVPASEKLSMTLQQVYDLWSKRKYEKAGDSSVRSYKASWKRVSRFASMKMRDITLDNWQSILDQDAADGKSKSLITDDRLLIRALCRFAMERDIIAKDYSEFLETPSVGAKYLKGALSELHLLQLKKLAESGTQWADVSLILCYTGFRISELLTLTPFSYDAKDDCLRGGMKTDAGKNRVVPVHPIIKSYLLAWLARGGDTIICHDDGRLVQPQYFRKCFRVLMNELGIPEATPHWCRHTFTTRLRSAGADELAVKRMLGHSDKDITDHYTHTDVKWLRRELLKIA